MSKGHWSLGVNKPLINKIPHANAETQGSEFVNHIAGRHPFPQGEGWG